MVKHSIYLQIQRLITSGSVYVTAEVKLKIFLTISFITTPTISSRLVFYTFHSPEPELGRFEIAPTAHRAAAPPCSEVVDDDVLLFGGLFFDLLTVLLGDWRLPPVDDSRPLPPCRRSDLTLAPSSSAASGAAEAGDVFVTLVNLLLIGTCSCTRCLNPGFRVRST